MQATISRQYREGHWSVYSESINDYWQEFLDQAWFVFDKDNELHRQYAEGFIQAKYGSGARVHLDFS